MILPADGEWINPCAAERRNGGPDTPAARRFRSGTGSGSVTRPFLPEQETEASETRKEHARGARLRHGSHAAGLGDPINAVTCLHVHVAVQIRGQECSPARGSAGRHQRLLKGRGVDLVDLSILGAHKDVPGEGSRPHDAGAPVKPGTAPQAKICWP